MKHLNTFMACALCMTATVAVAQKNPMTLPEVWNSVRYDIGRHAFVDEAGNARTDYEAMKAGKSTKELWRVFTDRENVALFDEPDGKEARRLEHMSTRLYVYNEKGPWVLVSTEATGPAQHWCHKKDLVLWSRPLGDHITGIELKAFVVNTTKAARAIASGSNKEKYDLLAAPSTQATRLKENFIYDVLFVFKEHHNEATGETFFLVSDEIELSAGEGLGLLGWINGTRVRTWETRLCLEPNFAPEALAERRDKSVQAKLFQQDKKEVVDQYLKDGGGKGLVDGAQHDPAFGKDPDRQPRMSGKIFRYPVIDARRGGLPEDNCHFLTGVSGYFTPSSSGDLEDYSAEDYHLLRDRRDKLKDRINDVNLVFAIDGSLGCEQHLTTVRTVVERLAKREGGPIEYSAVVYRNELSSVSDGSADPEANFRETIGPVSSAGQFMAGLEQVVPRNQGDKTDQRAVHFALKRAIELCQEDETNIIVHLGNRPDNSVVPFFTSQKDNGGTRIEAADLAGMLSKSKAVHYLGYVTWADPKTVDERSREMLYDGLGELMQNMANSVKNAFGGGLSFAGSGRDVEAARIAKMRMEGMPVTRMDRLNHWLMKTTMVPDKNGNNALAGSIRSNIDSCLILGHKLMEDLDRLFQNDSKLAEHAGDFTQRNAMEVLFADFDDPEERERLRKTLVANKAHIFVDARTVYRPAGLTSPMFRYVLFYEEKKLLDQINQLTELNRRLDGGDPAMVAEAFRSYWQEKARGVLGSGYKPTMKVVELLQRLQGVQDMDMVKPFVRSGTEIFGDLTIKDIEAGKKLPPDQFKKYQELVQKSVKELTALRDQPYFYENPESSSRFYWIPIEYVFN